jgi:tRNA nucleotidyltransferase/poly(A) polymerase
MKTTAREFAFQIVRQLRQAGFQALWAGGCVRDQLLGLSPQDYDVATNATPDQICRVFRGRRTLTIGAAFGVVVVVGPGRVGNVEVATFRSDVSYSDGRHPDQVTFSSPEEDARRRDFTINGMFYDPLVDRVIDYVGGQHDLRAGVIRAIGDPWERFSEDKLRLLRAVRFAAHFQFTLEPKTRQAIGAQPETIQVVSAERIGDEMRKILVDANRATGAGLLRETGLLSAILPEAKWLGRSADPNSAPPALPSFPPCRRAGAPSGEPESGNRLEAADDGDAWGQTVRILDRLDRPCFPTALAALVRRMHAPGQPAPVVAERICRRLKLANHQTNLTTWLLTHEPTIRRARHVPWPQLQPILVHPQIDALLRLSAAVAAEVEGDLAHIDYCRRKLELPAEQLNPAPLITGDDLIAHGLVPGRDFATFLSAARHAQLDQRISTRQEALELVDQLRRTRGSP